MHTAVRDRLGEITALCRKHHVQRLELFGSATGVDFDPTHSDVDMLVTFATVAEGQFSRNYFALAAGLEALLGRSVDLVIAGNIRNPYILQQVEATKETLYAS